MANRTWTIAALILWLLAPATYAHADGCEPFFREAALAALPSALDLAGAEIQSCRLSSWSSRSFLGCVESSLREEAFPCSIELIAVLGSDGAYCHYDPSGADGDACIPVDPGLLRKTLEDLQERIVRYSLPKNPKIIALAQGSRGMTFTCVPQSGSRRTGPSWDSLIDQ